MLQNLEQQLKKYAASAVGHDSFEQLNESDMKAVSLIAALLLLMLLVTIIYAIAAPLAVLLTATVLGVGYGVYRGIYTLIKRQVDE